MWRRIFVKRLIGAVLVGTFVFAGVFASASALPLSGGTIQAGSLDVSCQTNAVNVSYLTQINGSGVNEITSVTLSNIDPACQGKWADIALITSPKPYGSGVTAFNLWGLLDHDGSTTYAFATLDPKPLSSAVTGVHVQIKDAP
jgi:hypothetical protein